MAWPLGSRPRGSGAASRCGRWWSATPPSSNNSWRGELERIFLDQWGRVLASLIGFLGDFDLAEEAVQEAFAVAAERWPREGIPANPTGWLVVSARHRAIDRIRRERTLADKLQLLDRAQDTMDEIDKPTIQDERLELIFTCCHPALATEAQVALTLRALGGLSTEEIARAFLVSEETMKRRLSRAKAKIRQAGIPFSVPADHLLPDRLAAVLAVIYLVYNEGSGGRVDLAAEAIRLGHVLSELMPDEPEVLGLLALMVIHHSRRDARVMDGALILLGDQDRQLWDWGEIEAGRALVERAVALRGHGPYVLQAAIASLQTEDEIDWPEVVKLYGRLAESTGSSVVELNRAVALAETGATQEALGVVESLALPEYRYLHSTRAELLRRLGRDEEARAAYERALALTGSEPERLFLLRRISEL